MTRKTLLFSSVLLPRADKEAVLSDPTHKMLVSLEQAWNAGDAQRFAAHFREDADFVDVLGRRHLGRPGVERIHRANFDTIHRGSRLVLSALSTRSLGDDVLVSVMRGELEIPEGPLAPRTTATMTCVLQREGGAWNISAFHNTFVRSVPGVPEGGV